MSKDAPQKADLLFKIVMIGDHGVGKTQLINRYVKNDFDMHSKTTIGVEFITKYMTIDSTVIGAQLWDTVGEEKYKSLTSIYYKGAVGALLVYDITRKSTFERICAQWFTELKSFSDPNIVSILIGNKSDLNEKREVKTEEASTFAEKNGIAFIETSAKDATNVKLAYERVLNEIYKLTTKKEIKDFSPGPIVPTPKRGQAIKSDEDQAAEVTNGASAKTEKESKNVKLKQGKSGEKAKKKGCC